MERGRESSRIAVLERWDVPKDGVALAEVFPWILWNPRGLAAEKSGSFMV